MASCRLGLAVIASCCLLTVLELEPAQAEGRAGLGTHSRRADIYYCYPRKYWWFYRPYTTDKDGHRRCMPYFHNLGRASAPYFRDGGLAK
jgi:hypothetical protein